MAEKKQKEGSNGGLKFGQMAIKEKKLGADDVIKSLRLQEAEKSENKKKPSVSESGGYIRIPTQKVDHLVNMLGELLIFQSLLKQDASKHFETNDKYMNNLMRMAKIIKDVQVMKTKEKKVEKKSKISAKFFMLENPLWPPYQFRED